MIEDTSGSTVKGVEIECIKSDRCKVVLLVEPVKANGEADLDKTERPLEPSEG